jgi:hypothetical protein
MVERLAVEWVDYWVGRMAVRLAGYWEKVPPWRVDLKVLPLVEM